MRLWVLVALAMPSANDANAFVGCASCAMDESRRMNERFAPLPEPSASAARPAHVKVRYALAAGDVIEEDVSGQVAAVRHATTPVTWTRFKPGAVSPPNVLVVVGEIDDRAK